MLKAPLAPVVNAPPLAVSALLPARLIERSLKLANPLVSVGCVVVPLRLPVPVLKFMLTATPGTLLLKPSCARTDTAGLMTVPATASLGGCTKARLAAAAELTTTLLELTEITDGTAGTLKPIVMVLATLGARFVNDITPPSAVTLVVPCRI